ncbi:PqiA/YebS family transporter subunit [Duganella ginsengisoli]|uniref:PqiA/YebS family transporter subunit n=1 Tax=Pseudoduganella ginsengisoli TaxID=1462440 RepID=A0A6L6PXX4_9BURK|nr:PqiA/YebS family transporter subunit [Pseudoduganella ginsengisoli]
MYRYDLISCHDCGVLHRRRLLAPRDKARCVRCRSVLYRGVDPDLNRIAAITMGALIVFLIAQLSPIVRLEMNGNTSTSTLPHAVAIMWGQGMRAVSVCVALFTIVFPAIELVSVLYVVLGLRSGRQPPGMHWLLRGVRKAREWGMTEVLMIGILIGLIKMTSMSKVIIQPGLLAFGALTLMMAVEASLDPRLLWNAADRLGAGAMLAPAERAALETRAPMVACHDCGLVLAAYANRHGQRCARCGCKLHRRKPDSIMRTWAYLIAAAILYIPANLLPVLNTDSLYGNKDDTIISGVVYFWDTGAPELAVIIFVASIVVPMLKLAALSLLTWTAQRRSHWRPMQRTVLYRMVEFIGRWSMLDIFVITVSVALVRFDAMAMMTPRPGALAFCAVVVLTMFAALEFDPRLIWDPVKDKNGVRHV